jgi:hypothetical protein
MSEAKWPVERAKQVVRQVIGQHAGIPPGQHELPLDRQQQPPLLAARLVVDLERAGVAGQRNVDDRDPAVPVGGGLAAQRDLRPPVVPAVLAHCGALAQPGVSINEGGGLGLVPVVPVGLHDLGQPVVHRQQLRRPDRADVACQTACPCRERTPRHGTE